nr:hypothetical protein [Mycobacterium riyadhense]
MLATGADEVSAAVAALFFFECPGLSGAQCAGCGVTAVVCAGVEFRWRGIFGCRVPPAPTVSTAWLTWRQSDGSH